VARGSLKGLAKTRVADLQMMDFLTRWKYFIAFLLVVGVAGLVLVLSGKRSSGDAPKPRIVDETALGSSAGGSGQLSRAQAGLIATPWHKPCTSISEPTNFRYFSVGPAEGGDSVTEVVRRCDGQSTRRGPRPNYVDITYGSCSVPAGADSCSPPLDVQSFPTCERNLTQYQSEPGTPYPHGPLKRWKGGAVTVSFDGGTNIEVYTGQSTIEIWGGDPDRVARALEYLRPEPTAQSVEPPAADVSSPIGIDTLGPPARGALSGTVRCEGNSVH